MCSNAPVPAVVDTTKRYDEDGRASTAAHDRPKATPVDYHHGTATVHGRHGRYSTHSPTTTLTWLGSITPCPPLIALCAPVFTRYTCYTTHHRQSHRTLFCNCDLSMLQRPFIKQCFFKYFFLFLLNWIQFNWINFQKWIKLQCRSYIHMNF
jgi:hypothetical protein